jgi:antitoxin component YwqK of YwqJK toxin-antitoxin module
MFIKSLLVSIILLFLNQNTHAQKIKYFEYFLSKDLVSTDNANMEIYGEGRYQNNLFKLHCFLPNRTKLLMTAYFTDSSLAVFDGEYILYHQNGKVDTKGKYKMNKQIGIWQKWDSTGNIIDSTIYENNNAIISANYNYEINGKLKSYFLKDSLKNTYHTEHYDSIGSLISKADFLGNKGIFWRYTKDGIKQDSVFTRVETEADFPGGLNGWKSYLHNQDLTLYKFSGSIPSGRYDVIIRITVNEDGKISDIFPETYNGYGIEKEVMIRFKNSPKWIPAMQYGIKVKSIIYKKFSFPIGGNYFIKKKYPPNRKTSIK